MKQEAKAVLTTAGITLGQGFDSLDSAQIDAIRTEAAVAYQRKHGRPMPAPERETFVRKRYDLLQQRARS